MIRSPFPSPVPTRTVIGLEERITLVGEREVARTVNGRAVVLQPSYGSLYAVELSNGGVLTVPPPGLEIGDATVYDCQTWFVVTGYPGGQIALPRNPVPGCVDGRMMTVAADAPSVVYIHWRMRLDVVVADVDWSGAATRRDGSWSMHLEELDQIERLPVIPWFPPYPDDDEPPLPDTPTNGPDAT